MADWDSLLEGLNMTALAVFGREVVYTPQAGEPVAIRGVFQQTREAEDTSPGVYGVLFIRLSNLARAPARGDQVEASNLIYTVYDIEADGGGAAVLRLRRV